MIVNSKYPPICKYTRQPPGEAAALLNGIKPVFQTADFCFFTLYYFFTINIVFVVYFEFTIIYCYLNIRTAITLQYFLRHSKHYFKIQFRTRTRCMVYLSIYDLMYYKGRSELIVHVHMQLAKSYTWVPNQEILGLFCFENIACLFPCYFAKHRRILMMVRYPDGRISKQAF